MRDPARALWLHSMVYWWHILDCRKHKENGPDIDACWSSLLDITVSCEPMNVLLPDSYYAILLWVFTYDDSVTSLGGSTIVRLLSFTPILRSWAAASTWEALMILDEASYCRPVRTVQCFYGPLPPEQQWNEWNATVTGKLQHTAV